MGEEGDYGLLFVLWKGIDATFRDSAQKIGCTFNWTQAVYRYV